MRSGFVVLAGVALLALSGCKMKGEGKSMQPDFRTFTTAHPLHVTAKPIKSGALELRIREAVLEEHATVIKTEGWGVRVRGIVVASEAVPIATLRSAFTVLAKDGSVWRLGASVPGKPDHLAPNVETEVEFDGQIGNQETDQAIETFMFQDVRVSVSR